MTGGREWWENQMKWQFYSSLIIIVTNHTQIIAHTFQGFEPHSYVSYSDTYEKKLACPAGGSCDNSTVFTVLMLAVDG